MIRFTFEKRADSTPLGRTATIIGAVVLALVLGAGFLAAVGVDPLEAYALIVEEVFLSGYGWQDLLVKFTPLLFTGCAVALAARMRLWNIGAEGQFHMGTVFVTWGSLHLNPDTWGWSLLLVMGLLAKSFDVAVYLSFSLMQNVNPVRDCFYFRKHVGTKQNGLFPVMSQFQQ